MKVLEKVFIVLGFVLLALAAYSKFTSRPHITWGVRLISMVMLANSAFLIAILLKLSGKK